MKSFKPKCAVSNACAPIISTIMNILIIAVLFILINNYILSLPFDATWLMTMVLLSAINSFLVIGKKRKIEFDKNIIIFWLLFAIGYTAFGIYMQASPSIIALVFSFSVGSLVNIAIKKIKEYRAS